MNFTVVMVQSELIAPSLAGEQARCAQGWHHGDPADDRKEVPR